MHPKFLRPEQIPYASVDSIPATPPAASPVVDVAIVPVPDQPAGPVVDVALVRPPVRQPDVANPAQAATWYGANCPSWRKGGAQ